MIRLHINSKYFQMTEAQVEQLNALLLTCTPLREKYNNKTERYEYIPQDTPVKLEMTVQVEWRTVEDVVAE